MAVPIPVLKELELLRDLPAEALAALAPLAIEKSYSRREIVAEKDSTLFHMLFLVEGRLQGVDFTVDGREVGLYFVNPGQFFGELAVIDRRPISETVIAVARSRVVHLPIDRGRSAMFASPAASEQVALRLANRLRTVSAQRLLLGLPNPMQRLCAQLQLIADAPAADATQQTIQHAPTQQELAIMINTSRETVTRCFQVLLTRNAILRDGQVLVIADRKYIAAIADGTTPAPKV